MKTMAHFFKTAASVVAFSFVSSVASFASSSITLASATGAGPLSLSSLNLNSTIGATTGAVLDSGAVVLAFSSPTLSLERVLSVNSGALIKSGAGAITLNGSNTYSGTVSGASGSLQLSGNTGTLVYGGTLSINPGAFIQSEAGVITLNGGNTYSGTISVPPGSLQLSGNGTLVYGGTLSINPGAFIQSGAGVITLNAGNTYSGTISVPSGSLRLSGNTGTLINGATLSINPGTLIQSGAGVITLAGNGTNSGVLTINPGTLQLSGGGAVLGTGGTLVLAGGTLVQGGTILLTGGTVAPSTTYKLTASAVANGTISPSGVVTAAKGATKTYTITPASGYAVSQVTVDGSKKGAITSFTFNNLSGNHTISATFALLPTYKLTASTVGNGTISPSGVVTAAKGATKTYTITPAPGHVVSQVTVDGDNKGAITSFTFFDLNGNHTISATFASWPTYNLTASIVGNGTISPSGTVTKSKGSTTPYTITPAPGFVVSKVTVDGVQQGPLTSYFFKNLNANHTISATFVAKSPKNSSRPSAAPSAGSAYSGSAYFSVNALRGWQDTGVSVLKGQELAIIALDQVGFANAGELLGTIVPDGSSAVHSPVFRIGDDYKAEAKAGGRLWLRLNEGVSASKVNLGTISVQIHHSASGE